MPIFNKRWLLSGLLPFSLLFRLAVFLRNSLYNLGFLRTAKLNVPVISVGNLIVGGIGKIPAVEYIARLLLANRLCTAIITRGYGRQQHGTVVVSDGDALRATVEASGDEATLLATRLPRAVIVADEKKHRGAGHASTNFKVDALIVDDAFQHRKLHRDLDIVLIDVASFFENRWMLPAGPFREPLRALRRAQVIITTNANMITARELENLHARIRAITAARIFRASLEPKFLENIVTGKRASTSILDGNKVFAVCGIARPDRFFDDLRKMNAQIVDSIAFPDHHAFVRDEIAVLVERARAAHAEAIVITEKDAVKWNARIEAVSLPVFFLRVEFNVLLEAEAFDAHVLRVLGMG